MSFEPISGKYQSKGAGSRTARGDEKLERGRSAAGSAESIANATGEIAQLLWKHDTAKPVNNGSSSDPTGNPEANPEPEIAPNLVPPTSTIDAGLH